MSDPSFAGEHDCSLRGESYVRACSDSDGEVGCLWNGVPALLLTTTGRRTGQARTSALIFGRDGDDYLLIASTGGAPTHPSWYLNLDANPDAEIQVIAERVPVVARHASDDEKTRLWEIMSVQWPK